MSHHEAKFQIGQIIHHRLFDYVGVVFDVDPVFQGTEEWYAEVARSRLLLGDDRARSDLVNLLLSDDLGARQTAISALWDKYGDRRGYTPDAPLPERRAAAARWGQDAAGK